MQAHLFTFYLFSTLVHLGAIGYPSTYVNWQKVLQYWSQTEFVAKISETPIDPDTVVQYNKFSKTKFVPEAEWVKRKQNRFL